MKKKGRYVLSLGVGLLLLLAPAAGARQGDSVVASGSDGTHGPGFITGLDMNAANNSGYVTLSTEFFYPFTGRVTCLRVYGPDLGGGTASAPTTAILNVYGTLTTDVSSTTGLWTMKVVDNGGGPPDPYGDGLGTDQVSWVRLPHRSQHNCSKPAAALAPLVTLVVGRAVVTDAERR